MLAIRWILLLFFLHGLVFAAFPCDCRRFQLPGWWGSGEYVLFWTKKRFYPPLVTTNTQNNTPSLGTAGTEILFGNDSVRDSPQSGGKVDLGFWMLPCFGFGGGFLTFGKENVSFSVSGDATGHPILGQPYYDVTAGAQAAYVVSSAAQNQGFGYIDIKGSNHISGYNLYTRYRYFDAPFVKVDFLGGFCFLRVDDTLAVNSSTQGLLLGGNQVKIFDYFNARNRLYAGLLGVNAEVRTSCLAFQVIGKVALGNMLQRVGINGRTFTTTVQGITTVTPVGLLAQNTNIGQHTHDGFEVVSMLDAKVQYRFWSHFWLTAGYQFLYWPKVFLAGEQVDLNIGGQSPVFPSKENNFWAQGMTVGLYILY